MRNTEGTAILIESTWQKPEHFIESLISPFYFVCIGAWWVIVEKHQA